ncbi:MAG: XrtA/PEP-CTERM system-associated ATPase [Pseudomonadota bacterium]
MIEDYFGFSAQPFKLSPDTKFFFSSASHTKAMAYLHYGLRQAEGFIVITGEIGAGKSLLIEHMFDQINASSVSAAHIVTSSVEPDQLLAQVLSAFQIEPAGTGRTAELEAFEDFLFDHVNRGRRVLLVVDEAQNLPSRTIEELRMLTNINHRGTPLFQVFLVGQPEFRQTLARADMEQLRQRVIASYHLQALDRDETRDYIDYRLSVVGRTEHPAFTEEAFDAIHRHTDGVPRRINALCTRLLLFCALEDRTLINSRVVASVAAELAHEVSDAGALSLPSVSSVNSDVLAARPANDGSGVAAPPADPAPNAASHDGQISASLTEVATALSVLAAEKSDGLVPPNGREEAPSTQNQAEKTPLSEAQPQTPTQTQTPPIRAAQPPGTERQRGATVMDHILALRQDLRKAHQGNREIYDAIATLEDQQSDNVIQLTEHLDRADGLLRAIRRHGQHTEQK